MNEKKQGRIQGFIEAARRIGVEAGDNSTDAPRRKPSRVLCTAHRAGVSPVALWNGQQLGQLKTEINTQERYTCPQTSLTASKPQNQNNCWCGWLCSVHAASPRGFGGASPPTTPRLGVDRLGTPDKASHLWPKPPRSACDTKRRIVDGSGSERGGPTPWGLGALPRANSCVSTYLQSCRSFETRPWWGRHVLGM